ncbi:hypothetical protein UAW_01664 [Enterococcus haemoperoxidus ATCC BAA-382]|uniref:Uncharacterized protein n=1 Tax=Enterococcus haemoperoxidus ATCC BAA-382 TaxID=1158608 RepID=R2QKR9_9ENTE|nr:hypothetical protein UAW_01664 [Enterococcus haemoperoxidus ATCC BAA-382]EOT59995.1 hypothetical protein I583_02630 [Enterococcus haemoperoxidus ATCC BAA-382]
MPNYGIWTTFFSTISGELFIATYLYLRLDIQSVSQDYLTITKNQLFLSLLH